MAESASSDVLGQKAQAAQRAMEARGMSPSKALRRALSRTADVLWDLALVCQSVVVEVQDQDGVIACLQDDELLLLLDGPDGALGLVAVDRAILTGVIEVQTIAQVTTMPPEERALTSTDAAMFAPLIDGAITRFAENLDGDPMKDQIAGFRFGAMLEDRRAAGLLLEAAHYHSFAVDMDLALGRRKGTLRVILPERAALVPKGHAHGQSSQNESPHEKMFEQLQIRLEAVLGRISLPLSKAQSLRAGDLLPLNADSLEDVQLLATQGHVVARGKLGQLSGAKALRVTWPEQLTLPAPDPELPSVSDKAGKSGNKPQKKGAPSPTVVRPDDQEIAVLDLPALLGPDQSSAPDFDETDADREFADLADPLLDFDQSLSD